MLCGKMGARATGKVGLGPGRLVKEGGRSGGGRSDDIARQWIDECVRDGVVERRSVHVSTKRGRIGRGCGGRRGERFRDLVERKLVASHDHIREGKHLGLEFRGDFRTVASTRLNGRKRRASEVGVQPGGWPVGKKGRGSRHAGRAGGGIILIDTGALAAGGGQVAVEIAVSASAFPSV